MVLKKFREAQGFGIVAGVQQYAIFSTNFDCFDFYCFCTRETVEKKKDTAPKLFNYYKIYSMHYNKII